VASKCQEFWVWQLNANTTFGSGARSQSHRPQERQISWESGAGKSTLQVLPGPKSFIIGQFWGHTVNPEETLDWPGITVLTPFDRENLAKLKHTQKLQQLCLGNDTYCSDCSCQITYIM